MATESCATLFDNFADSERNETQARTEISQSVYFVDHAGARVVFHWHDPLYRFSISDSLSVRFVAVHLRLAGLATQEEVAAAFGHSVATQRRWENRYHQQGLKGLEKGKSSGRPPGVPETCDGLLREWFRQEVSNVEMARRLGVSSVAIHRALARLGLRRRRQMSAELPWTDDLNEQLSPAHDDQSGASSPPAEDGLPEELTMPPELELSQDQDRVGDAVEESSDAQAESVAKPLQAPQLTVLPTANNSSHPVKTESLEDALERLAEEGFTLDCDPDDRTGDRGLARLGQLEDALPMFKDRPCLARAGVLLVIPLLCESGLLKVFFDTYRSLGPAFYGLRTTVVVLFLTALLRIKRPEHLKEYSPRELGHVMGLDRAPEVKTVRRKLTELAAQGCARKLMQALAQRRIDEDPDRVAFLYVDGHVREYHGQQKLAKAKKSQSQVAKPAATDNWVHDAYGEPLLVVTSEMNEGLTKVLEPILKDVKTMVGDRRPTVIFDRGGFSPKLFVRLRDAGFEVMTYRKGTISPWPLSHFATADFVADDRTYHYDLAERKRVKVGRLRPKRKKKSESDGPQYLWMREVRVLRADGRQTAILLSRQDLDAPEVPYRQFNRWRQENYFKYMGAEYELDGLVEYQVQDVAEGRDRPNPARRPVERTLGSAKARVQRLQAELGDQIQTPGKSTQRTMRGFKIAHAKLRAELAEAEREVAHLQEQLDELPKRVPADDLKTQTTEKKLIMDTIKMAAYQAETRLLSMLGEHYCRADDEGRTLLQAAFQSTARLEVTKDELLVELAAQSSPHRTEALRHLCENLNALSATFPGTRLRLRLAVPPHEPLTNG